MLRLDISLGSTTASSWSTLQPALGGTGNFAAAFQQVHADIKQVIEHGWPGDALPALRPEAQIHRMNSAPAGAALSGNAVSSESPQAFLAAIAPWARQAAQSLGVSTELVAAHAALESGWGQRQLRDASGHTTHNLFGLKARRVGKASAPKRSRPNTKTAWPSRKPKASAATPTMPARSTTTPA